MNKPKDEIVAQVIGRGIPILSLVVFLIMGFFVKDTSVYKDLHPFTFWDGVGMALFVPVIVFISGMWDYFFKETAIDMNKLQWYHYVGIMLLAFIGVLLIIGVNG